jgi:hypothetical protein
LKRFSELSKLRSIHRTWLVTLHFKLNFLLGNIVLAIYALILLIATLPLSLLLVA